MMPRLAYGGRRKRVLPALPEELWLVSRTVEEGAGSGLRPGRVAGAAGRCRSIRARGRKRP